MRLTKTLFIYLQCVVILFSAFYACADNFVDPISNTTYSTTTFTQNDNTHQIALDECSPLCTCNCCAASVVVTKALIISHALEQNNFTEPSMEYVAVKMIYQSIWKPPQLLS